MASFADKLLTLVRKTPGLTDRELAHVLLGRGKHPSQVNQEARLLAQGGYLIRKRRGDGLIRNFPGGHAVDPMPLAAKPVIERTPERLSEDEIKEALEKWLRLRPLNFSPVIGAFSWARSETKRPTSVS